VIAHGDEGEAGGVVVVDESGRLLRQLAIPGGTLGEVLMPTAIAVHEAASEEDTLVAVLDSDAERVQYFALDGRCFGSVLTLPGAPADEGETNLPVHHKASD
jgi:hypothetical protein